MRRVQELPQKQVAERLGLTEKTIEKHLKAGTRQLAHYMRENALPSGAFRNDVDEAQNDEAGDEHGTHKRD